MYSLVDLYVPIESLMFSYSRKVFEQKSARRK
jgi:hypothetical protein